MYNINNFLYFYRIFYLNICLLYFLRVNEYISRRKLAYNLCKPFQYANFLSEQSKKLTFGFCYILRRTRIETKITYLVEQIVLRISYIIFIL